jgi:hypothetical protein
MQGTLMDFWPRVVWECNSGCACNKNTCGNRAVGRGMTLNIEVGCVTNAHQQGGDQEWAVFAGESIIKGTFVCEVAGQVRNVHRYTMHCTCLDMWNAAVFVFPCNTSVRTILPRCADC